MSYLLTSVALVASAWLWYLFGTRWLLFITTCRLGWFVNWNGRIT